ncbi:MAG: AAC(3) family N-acetyltransferase [Verrucomicrobia bacterium]|nr:AAC(3) family N-acetyltransferase [Verrucomicrobiota bacterium]
MASTPSPGRTLRQFCRTVIPELYDPSGGHQALADVTTMVTTERWNSFDQFHKTTRFLMRAYDQAGAQASCIPIPTGGPFGDGRWMIREASDVRGATADVVSPVRQRLLDFRENPWHVVQWSAATPPGGLTGVLVIIDRAEALRAVAPQSLAGKVILSRMGPWHRSGDFVRTGALGLICDPTVGTGCDGRRRGGMPDAVEWTKIGWGGPLPEHALQPLVALALSFRQGQQLRQLIAKHRRVRVRLKVDLRRYVGTHDLVSGLVVGRDDPQDELWCLAHSAEPGAIDNASGVAVCLAAARRLEQGIREGRFPRPRRSIRFLNGYECYSFFHYLEHGKRLQPPLAGLVVDGVGARPKFCDGLINWHQTVGSSAGFVDALGPPIIHAALKLDNPGYRLRRSPFVSTEDTLIGDPQYGFPCPWLNTHWKASGLAFDAYHTSADVPALLSTRGLTAMTTMTAGYLSYLANAGTDELGEMAVTETRQTLAELAAHADRKSRAWADAAQDKHHVSMVRLQRWLWGGDRGTALKQLSACEKQVREAVGAFGARPRKTVRVPGANRIPFRCAPLAPCLENVATDDRKRIDFSVSRLGLFYADGRRSLQAIAERLATDAGAAPDVSHVVKSFEGLESIGFVKLVDPKALKTRAALVQDLRQLGLAPGVSVMVHSSLSKIGMVQGGAETVIDALCQVVGRSGTLMMPSFNHGEAWVYNPMTTPTTNGAIPDAFWRRANVVRSQHGTHAVAAIGAKAAEYCAGHVDAGIWAENSPIGRLIHDGGLILALGVPLTTATAYHVAEISMPCGCLALKGGTDRVVDGAGDVQTQPGLVWRGGDCPVSVTRLEDDLDRQGRLKRGAVGDASAILVQAKDLWMTRRKHLKSACTACAVRPDPKWKSIQIT